MARVFTEGFEFGDVLFFDVPGSSVAVNSTAGNQRSGTYGCSMGTSNSIKNITAIGEFYARFGVKDTTWGTEVLFSWYNGTTVLGSVRVDSTSKKITIYVGTTLQTVTGQVLVLAPSTWYLFEVHVKIANAGGAIDVRVDGIADSAFSGDTQPGAATTVDVLRYYRSGNTCYMDDIGLNDTTGGADNSWCGDGRVIAIKPNADGDSSQLTGSDGNSTNNYLLVDDIPTTTADYCEAAAASNLYDLYNLSASGLGSVNVLRLWPEVRALDTVAAGGTAQIGIKTGATEDWSSNVSLLTSNARFLGKTYTVKPAGAGGGSWSVSDVDALQAGFKAT